MPTDRGSVGFRARADGQAGPVPGLRASPVRVRWARSYRRLPFRLTASLLMARYFAAVLYGSVTGHPIGADLAPSLVPVLAQA